MRSQVGGGGGGAALGLWLELGPNGLLAVMGWGGCGGYWKIGIRVMVRLMRRPG